MFFFQSKKNSISIEDALKLVSEDSIHTHLIDVREVDEWKQGHLPGAKLIPVFQLQARLPMEFPNREDTTILYCLSGSRASRCMRLLESMGYSNVKNAGGIMFYRGGLVQ